MSDDRGPFGRPQWKTLRQQVAACVNSPSVQAAAAALRKFQQRREFAQLRHTLNRWQEQRLEQRRIAEVAAEAEQRKAADEALAEQRKKGGRPKKLSNWGPAMADLRATLAGPNGSRLRSTRAARARHVLKFLKLPDTEYRLVYDNLGDEEEKAANRSVDDATIISDQRTPGEFS